MTKDKQEATGIAYTNFKTPNGFKWSFTVRTPVDTDENNDLIAEIDRLEDIFKTSGWTPEDIRPNYSKGVQNAVQRPTSDLDTPPEEGTQSTYPPVLCGIHGTPMTKIPAGVSKTTGRAYNSFLVCNQLNADGSKCTWKPEKK